MPIWKGCEVWLQKYPAQKGLVLNIRTVGCVAKLSVWSSSEGLLLRAAGTQSVEKGQQLPAITHSIDVRDAPAL